MSANNPLEGFGAAGAEAAAMIEAVLPGVVQVQSEGRRRRRRHSGTGAGFLWSPDGSVMTNHHVIGRPDGEIRVTLADDRSFAAEVVASSRRLDLAMLRLRGALAEDLPTLSVGDSDTLRVGELVFAVGHPWGRRGAVTAGVVSGLDSIGGPFGRARYVQTDAYLAPGNSGGPLVNARGQVVGVNAMISGGLALAIPSNTAGAWATGGGPQRRRRPPRLGVRVREARLPVSSPVAAGQEVGLVIVGMASDGPATRAGLLIGDVLLRVAGEAVGDDGVLRAALERAVDVEDPVRLHIMRGGEVREVEVRLEAWRSRARGA